MLLLSYRFSESNIIQIYASLIELRTVAGETATHDDGGHKCKLMHI